MAVRYFYSHDRLAGTRQIINDQASKERLVFSGLLKPEPAKKLPK